MHSKVAIVILNWNGAKLLRQFLPSVIGYSKNDFTKIVVADNGSTDDSIPILQAEFPQLEILDLKQNHGFAKGYNEALKQLDAEFFVLLNSDVEVTEGWLDEPIRILESDASVAAVQPKIRSFHHRNEFEYAGAAGGFIDRFGYPLCRGRIFNVLETDSGQYDQQTDIFWASGACMFIRAAHFHEAGGFDADFWAHMEEIDLCWRLKNKGYRIAFCPESMVYHVGGGTLAYDNPMKLFLNFRNNLWLLYKNLPANQLFYTITLRMILDAFAAFKLLAEFNLNGIKSVLKAHYHFYKSLPRLREKRISGLSADTKALPDGMLRKSIVFQFYVRKRNRFSEIQS